MAIFKDDNGDLYLGILQIKSGEKYSGNFIKLSDRSFKFIVYCNRILIGFSKLLFALLLMLAAVRSALDSKGILDVPFAVIGAVICAISISYFAIGPIIISRNKLFMRKRHLDCLPKESASIYLLVFLCSFGLFLDTTLSGFLNIFTSGFMLLFTVVPIVVFSGIGYLYYSKLEN